MTKQQLLGRKRGSAKNNNDKVVPDFGDLMDAGCAMVQAPADMDAADALTLSYEPQDKHENRPLSPGAILEKAEQDATKVSPSLLVQALSSVSLTLSADEQQHHRRHQDHQKGS